VKYRDGDEQKVKRERGIDYWLRPSAVA